MCMSFSFGVYNSYKKLLKSFNGYDEAFQFIKSLSDVSYYDVLYLFDDKPTRVIVTKCLYIQRFLESGGGVQPFGNKYYFNKERLGV